MGKLKQRGLQVAKEEADREKAIKNACDGVQQGRFASIRKAAEAYGVHYSTVRRRLRGAKARKLAHVHQQLSTPAEERAIVRWIVRLEEFGFPPRVSHVKEAIVLLKHPELSLEEEAIEGYFEGAIGKNYLTRFLNRHPDLVSKLSSNFDKRRIKQSDPGVIQRHFARVQQVRKKYSITERNTYNMDEKGFRQGVSDRAKVICLRQERGMTGKMATDGTRELITVVETISGDGMALSPLIIYKGVAYYMGWYQHLDSLINICKSRKFTYSKTGWNNSFLSVKWLEHFDNITKERLVST